MGRPFAVIGFTMFISLFMFGILESEFALASLLICCFLLPVCFAVPCVRKSKVFPLALSVIILSASSYLICYHLSYLPAVEYSGKRIRVDARITALPSYNYGKYYYEIEAEKLDGEKTDKNIKLRLSSAEKLSAEAYDRVSFSGTVYALGSSGRFSRLNYMSKDVYIGIYPEDEITVHKNQANRPLHFYVLALRQKILDSVAALMPADNAALASAVLLGEKSYMSEELKNDVNNVGISHLICVSGLHLALLMSALLGILKRLQVPRKLTYIITMIFVVAFSALCTFTVSVVRAGIMLLVYLAAELLFAESDSLNSLGFACTVILLPNPFGAGSISLIFSVLAAFSIITVSSKISKKLKAVIFREKMNLPRKIICYAAEIFITSAVVLMISLPVSVMVFKKITLMSVFANILIIPFAGILLVCTAVSSLLFLTGVPFISFLYYPFAYLSSFISGYIIKISAFLSDFPLAVINADKVYILVFFALALIATAVIVLFRLYNKTFLTSVSIALCAVLAVSAIADSVCRKDDLIITCLAVDGAVALTVQCGGETSLIGCGENYNTAYKIRQITGAGSAGRIKYCFLPGDSRRESGAVSEVLPMLDAEQIIVPKNSRTVSEISRYGSSEVCSVSYGVFELSNGGYIVYSDSGYCLINAYGVHVLLVSRSGAEPDNLPEEFSDYDYLICAGKANNSIVKSSLNGIIVLSDERACAETVNNLKNKGHCVYGVSSVNNAELRIGRTKTSIRSVKSWA